VRQAVVNFEFIWDLAAKIDRAAMKDARERANAIAGQKAVYAALGMDGQFEANLIRRRQRARV
jgi:xylose isomerase